MPLTKRERDDLAYRLMAVWDWVVVRGKPRLLTSLATDLALHCWLLSRSAEGRVPAEGARYFH